MRIFLVRGYQNGSPIGSAWRAWNKQQRSAADETTCLVSVVRGRMAGR